MKKNKLVLTGFAVVVVVGSALAVEGNFFNAGSVYCVSTCITSSRVDFRNNPSGAFTNPCGTTSGVENHSYIFDETNFCRQNNLGLKYEAVPVGN